MIDYNKIIEELETDKVIDLLTQLGADRYKITDNAVIFPTICHNIDSNEASMKLYYYLDSHMFYCYTDEGSMSIFKFLKNFYETRQIEYDWYNDIYQVVINCSLGNNYNFNTNIYKSIRENYAERKIRKDLQEYPKGILDVFIKEYPVEWLNDNISKEAMDKYNIRYSIAQNKIIIPHFDVNNRLVGIRGRALNDWEVETVGKYMPVQIEEKWYSHPLSLNLYGLNFNISNIKKYGICFIFESEKSCLQCESFSMPNLSVASCGSNLNKFQIDLLVRTCAPREIVICYDKEQINDDKYFNKLWDISKKYNKYTDVSFIYDKENLLGQKDSPSDKGEEIFKQLLNRKVKVR